MNKITAFLIFAWITVLIVAAYPNLAKSQSAQKALIMICGDTISALQVIPNKWNQYLVWTGTSKERINNEGEQLVALYQNRETNAWTFLLIYDHSNTSCIAFTGQNGKVMDGRP
ncbi:MAG: hypothetical protein CMM49_02255 [Rhodospirillaceae bacterium]|nr:hypothetical protein [Rhodospirillaceae bacterium]